MTHAITESVLLLYCTVLYCTDVVAIKTAITPRFDLDEQCELWIEFGVGKHHRYLVVHEIADALGPVRSMALPVFHSLTGCDDVSTCQGTALNFISLDNIHNLQRFIALNYDYTSDCMEINAARAFHKEGEDFRKHSSNRSCITTACRTCNPPSCPCVGSGFGH